MSCIIDKCAYALLLYAQCYADSMKNKASLKSTAKSDSSLPSQGVCNLSGNPHE